MSQNYNIAVVDDHPIFLKGLIEVLQDELPNSFIDSYQSSILALQKIPTKKCDIAILDLYMPEINGINLATELKKIMPKIKIIILTMHKEPDIVRSVIAKGIDGYVLKDDAVNELVIAIDNVITGSKYISNNSLIDNNNNNKDSDLLNSLTKTELLVLKAVSKHKISRDIAEEMFISIKTVENHRNNISKKLQIQGSNSLLKFALENKKYF